MIKIGNLNISSFKLGGADCSIYLGDTKLYPTEEPTPPQYEGFCKLTLNDGSVEELEGSGELTSAMISSYQSTLVSAEIGTLCTSISAGAFKSCINLTNVDIPNSVTNIGMNAFNGCTSLTSIDIPSGVTSINNRAFYNCSSLTSIDIPSGVTTIGNNAFNYCDSLTSVTIPNSVTKIGNQAFNGCTSLTSVNIPNSVTSIGTSAFANCSGLTSVTVESTTPPTLGSSVFTRTSNNLVIYVPSGSVDVYKAASGWSTYASRIQAIPT